MKRLHWILLLGFATVCAQAAIDTYTGAIAPQAGFPADVSLNQAESDEDILTYTERQSFMLPEDLAVDISADGTYNEPDDLTPGIIPAGTLVNCYLVHIDKVGDTTTTVELSGSVTFENAILGIIVTTPTLDSSDGIVGRAGVVYGPRYVNNVDDYSDLELSGEVPGPGQDELTLAGSTVSIIAAVSTKMDEIRIIELVTALVVDIDIKPHCDPNPINLSSRGLLAVAIFSSEDFDATTVDPATVSLAGAGVAIRGKHRFMAQSRDVNGDGLLDLVVKVETQDLDPDLLQGGFAVLTGLTFSGLPIEGTDEVNIVH